MTAPTDGESPGDDQIVIGIEDRDLRLEVFAICDSAVEFDGRLNIFGTYETLGSPSFPFTLPTASVVLRIRTWPTESRRHDFRIGISSPDGLAIIKPFDFSGTVNNRFRDRSSAFNLIVNLQEVPFYEAGEHSVDFHLNGKLEGRLPLLIRRQ